MIPYKEIEVSRLGRLSTLKRQMSVPVILMFLFLIVFTVSFSFLIQFIITDVLPNLSYAHEFKVITDYMSYLYADPIEREMYGQLFILNYFLLEMSNRQYPILYMIANEPYTFLIFIPLTAIVLISFFILFQWIIGPSVMKRTLKLRYLRSGENIWLEKTVSEIAEKSGLPKLKIGIWPSEQPNTCVYGRTARGATLAISIGLLKHLNKGEIRAVIAHEFGHLKHKDYLTMTCLGSLPLMYYRIGRFFLYNDQDKLRGVLPLLLFGLIGLFAFLIYALTQLSLLSLSRMREFYSDAYAVYLTRKPRQLRSALTKIAYGLSLNPRERYGANAFFIEDPGNAKNEIKIIIEKGREYDFDRDGTLDEKELQIAMEREAKKSRFNRLKNLFSTHPPTYKRILLLKQIENEMASGRYTEEDIYKYI